MNSDIFNRFNNINIISHQQLQEQKEFYLGKDIAPYIDLSFISEINKLSEQDLYKLYGMIGYKVLKELNIENENLYQLREKIYQYNKLQQLREGDIEPDRPQQEYGKFDPSLLKKDEGPIENPREERHGEGADEEPKEKGFFGKVGDKLKGVGQTVGGYAKEIGKGALKGLAIGGAGAAALGLGKVLLGKLGGGIATSIAGLVPGLGGGGILGILGTVAGGLLSFLGLKGGAENLDSVKAQLQQAQAGQNGALNFDVRNLMQKAKMTQSDYAQKILTQLTPVITLPKQTPIAPAKKGLLG